MTTNAAARRPSRIARGRLRAAPLAAALVAAGVGVVAPTTASAKATAATISCKTFARDAAKSSGKDRTNALRQLKRCKATNRANKLVLAAVRNSHLVGTRGDGATVDWTFCANGRYDLKVTSDGSTGSSTGTRWRVTDATYRSTSTFTAVIEDRSEGTSVGVARKAGAWKVAVSRSFGELESVGPAERTAATTCG